MDTKTRRRLPIGLQTLRHLEERKCYYVDKTGYIARLVDEGTHYFLSRPRRFGKSLLLDTLKELFEGNESLFAGLHVHDRWDWSVRHPVVRLDFGGGHFATPGGLESNLMEQLCAAERRAEVTGDYATAPGASQHCWRLCIGRRGGGSWCWSTSTTSRSWMPSMLPTSPAPTATTCAA